MCSSDLVETVTIRQAEIEQDEVIPLGGTRAAGGLDVFDLETGIPETPTHHRGDGRVVFDEKHLHRSSFADAGRPTPRSQKLDVSWISAGRVFDFRFVPSFP